MLCTGSFFMLLNNILGKYILVLCMGMNNNSYMRPNNRPKSMNYTPKKVFIKRMRENNG